MIRLFRGQSIPEHIALMYFEMIAALEVTRCVEQNGCSLADRVADAKHAGSDR